MYVCSTVTVLMDNHFKMEKSDFEEKVSVVESKIKRSSNHAYIHLNPLTAELPMRHFVIYTFFRSELGVGCFTSLFYLKGNPWIRVCFMVV